MMWLETKSKTRNGKKSRGRGRGQLCRASWAIPRSLKVIATTKEPQEHETARFTFFQAPLHCVWVEGEFELDEPADKGC